MEEILASIRKIISEDSTEPQAAAPAPQPAPKIEAAKPEPVKPEPAKVEADVLELTQEVEEIPEPAPQPAPVQAVAPALEPVPEAVRPADEVVFQTIDDEAPASVAAQAPTQPVHELVSDKARSAVDTALSGLDFGSGETADAAPVAPINGHSVESVFDRAIRETFDPVLRAWLQEQADVIAERMKPAIREWMEENLPSMLRTAVEAEVARAVRARSRR